MERNYVFTYQQFVVRVQAGCLNTALDQLEKNLEMARVVLGFQNLPESFLFEVTTESN